MNLKVEDFSEGFQYRFDFVTQEDGTIVVIEPITGIQLTIITKVDVVMGIDWIEHHISMIDKVCRKGYNQGWKARTVDLREKL